MKKLLMCLVLMIVPGCAMNYSLGKSKIAAHTPDVPVEDRGYDLSIATEGVTGGATIRHMVVIRQVGKDFNEIADWTEQEVLDFVVFVGELGKTVVTTVTGVFAPSIG